MKKLQGAKLGNNIIHTLHIKQTWKGEKKKRRRVLQNINRPYTPGMASRISLGSSTLGLLSNSHVYSSRETYGSNTADCIRERSQLCSKHKEMMSADETTRCASGLLQSVLHDEFRFFFRRNPPPPPLRCHTHPIFSSA
jgi:hypothetical protein